MKIVPSTRKISTMQGTMPLSTRHQSAQPRWVSASSGSGGTRCGAKIETAAMKATKSSNCRMEGPMAPAYMSPTDLPSWSPSTISTSEGGITWVMVPEAAITPVAIRMS
jgi:hypothetical protein